MMSVRWLGAVGTILSLVLTLSGQGAVPRDQIQKMQAAAPAKAPATPQKARQLLVYTATKGFRHSSIPLAAESLKYLGEKTGAYQTVITADASYFEPEKLNEFAAVCFDQCTGNPFDDPQLKTSLLDFVKSGKGFIGIHAATDCFYDWKDFGEMIGGYFAGHPFSRISVKIDDPKSPINAAFRGKGFEITDEIYTFRAPYSREKLRVLLSIDWKNSGALRGGNRKDNDYALSWIQEYGKGRVFYCAFGHIEPIWWNKAILAHYLAGIQYALGDLKADAQPTAKIQPPLESVPGPKLR